MSKLSRNLLMSEIVFCYGVTAVALSMLEVTWFSAVGDDVFWSDSTSDFSSSERELCSFTI